MNILLVDDDEVLLRSMARDLSKSPIELKVKSASGGDEALSMLQHQTFDLVISDVRMPSLSGDRLLEQIKELQPLCEVVLATGHGSIEQAKWAVRFGAFDYIEKPFEGASSLLSIVERVAKKGRSPVSKLAPAVASQQVIDGVFGCSASMVDLSKMVRSVAQSRVSVLIYGESGTGKELIARAIHRLSDRKGRPFVAINCGALNENLLESELFGHVKGAFTGADSVRRGVFEAADGGTLFLDEVGDMAPSTQVRILRVLQEGEVRRLGSNESIPVDVRVVAASHVRLSDAVKAGTFREDLYYRLAVMDLAIPPLRDRGADIVVLANELCRRFAAQLGKAIVGFTEQAQSLLCAYAWPGNVRELENVVHRAVVLTTTDKIDCENLPANVVGASGSRDAPVRVPILSSVDVSEPFSLTKRRVVDGFERRYLAELMEQANGNLSLASRRSGIDRSNLRRMLKGHGLAYAAQDTD